MYDIIYLIFGIISLIQAIDNDKIQIKLFTQSLCPHSQTVMWESLKTALECQNLDEIVDIQLIPFGNSIETTNIDGTYSYTCQFGYHECSGNLMQSCAIYKYGQKQGGLFSICIQQTPDHGNYYQQIDYCSNQYKINYTMIQECMFGYEGQLAQHMMKELTPQNIQYVPNFSINGVFDDDIRDKLCDNMVKYICRNFKREKQYSCCQINSFKYENLFTPVAKTYFDYKHEVEYYPKKPIYQVLQDQQNDKNDDNEF